MASESVAEVSSINKDSFADPVQTYSCTEDRLSEANTKGVAIHKDKLYNRCRINTAWVTQQQTLPAASRSVNEVMQIKHQTSKLLLWVYYLKRHSIGLGVVGIAILRCACWLTPLLLEWRSRMAGSHEWTTIVMQRLLRGWQCSRGEPANANRSLANGIQKEPPNNVAKAHNPDLRWLEKA